MLTTVEGNSNSFLPTKEISSLRPTQDPMSSHRNIAGLLNQHPEKLSTKLEDNLVGISAGLNLPFTKFHFVRSMTFLIATTLFSTQGSQLFSFPLIQQRATSESVQQNTSFNSTRFFNPTRTSLINLLRVKQPKSSNLGIVSDFKPSF